MYDTIPFAVEQGKLTFGAKIDGKPVKLILDTGGTNIIVSDSVQRLGVEFLHASSVVDANNASIEAWVGKVRNFSVGRFWGWQSKEVTVIAGNRFFRELGVAGTVSGDMFKEACLVIDKRAGHFVICYPYRPSGISRTAGVTMDMGQAFHPTVPVMFGEREIKVLFDTGASFFLSLGGQDHEAVKDQTELTESGHGLLYVGAAGTGSALVDSIYKVNIPRVTLPGGKVLENVGTLVGGHSTTIAGQQMLDMGVMMLDFPRGLFYFFPYETEPTDVSSVTRVWNAKILPVVEDGKGLWRVVATLGDAGVETGERVWSIGGTDLADEELSESVALRLLGDADEATITVGDSRREVTIRKI